METAFLCIPPQEGQFVTISHYTIQKYLPALSPHSFILGACDLLKWGCTWTEDSSHQSSAAVGVNEQAALLTLIPISCPTLCLPIDNAKPSGERGCVCLHVCTRTSSMGSCRWLRFAAHMQYRQKLWGIIQQRTQRTPDFMHANSLIDVNEITYVCKLCT